MCALVKMKWNVYKDPDRLKKRAVAFAVSAKEFGFFKYLNDVQENNSYSSKYVWCMILTIHLANVSLLNILMIYKKIIAIAQRT